MNRLLANRLGFDRAHQNSSTNQSTVSCNDGFRRTGPGGDQYVIVLLELFGAKILWTVNKIRTFSFDRPPIPASVESCCCSDCPKQRRHRPVAKARERLPGGFASRSRCRLWVETGSLEIVPAAGG